MSTLQDLQQLVEVKEELEKLNAKLSFQSFRERYLPQQFTSPKFHEEIFGLLERYQRLLIIAPRSFAKSTISSFAYPLWKALTYTEKPHQILFVSSTADLSVTWLRKIKFELEHNQTLIKDFGDQTTNKWTEDHVILKTQAEIKAVGVGHQIRGRRHSLVLLDDIENDENVQTEEQRAKLKDWFMKALVNTLEPSSQLVVVGTLLHPFSLLAELYETQGAWMKKKYQAITEGESLWPEKWPLEKLEARRKEIGEVAFLSEFQNQPLSMLNALVKPEWI